MGVLVALKDRNIFKISLSNLIIGFTCLAFGYLFKVLVVFIAVTGEGQCLHSFWLGNEKYFNPFFITVVCVSSFLIYGVIKSGLTLIKPKGSRNSLLFYIVMCGVMVVWLNVMYGMWLAFEYEKGNLAAKDYFSNSHNQLINIWDMETLHVCKGGD
ncbi:hypothetical protein [Alteromonas flava]|uniref:hypothetical protein n=1 Tax=Alteromonas flava TaxID=2048003 RepID=UPI000C288BB5|nr:hypothetical protein [Alteromonas flava]